MNINDTVIVTLPVTDKDYDRYNGRKGIIVSIALAKVWPIQVQFDDGWKSIFDESELTLATTSQEGR